eukprot:11825669-Ditylum_brightwellii.AAC.1
MVRFYGILLRMSIEPCHLGGYQAYFKPTTRIDLASGYVQEFNSYGGWASEIMSLAHFRQIRSAFHPEARTSAVGNKCHQLRYLIQKTIRQQKKHFILYPTWHLMRVVLQLAAAYAV